MAASSMETESGAVLGIFDDGKDIQSLTLNPGNTFDLSHRYVDEGVYTVYVSVFKDDLEYGMDFMNVTVENVPPGIVSISVLPRNPYQPGVPFDCTVVFSDPGILDSHLVVFTWGDGTTTSVAADVGITTVSSSHSYSKAGTYEISVTLSDDDGGVDESSMSVVVNNPPSSPAVGLKELISGLKIPRGLKSTLLMYLDDVPHLLKHHRIHAVVHQLQAFTHYVKSQSGKRLTVDQAQVLINAAQVLIQSLRMR